VSSEGVGRGASFEIRLNRVVNEAGASSEASPVVSTAKRRILVVDDNRDGADLLAQLLQEVGHEVVTAYTSLDALELQRRFQPEIALLDIGLPEIDGYELARRMRAERKADALQLIAISGYAQDADREPSRQAGFAAHLLKPVDFQVLQRLLSDPPTAQPH
jgi:CheY-like chemotaxis protein